MGALASLLPVLGLVAGLIIARFTKSEIKTGRKHLELLQKALLATIAGTMLWNFGIFISAPWGIVIFLLILRHNIPLELIPFLAIPSVLAEQTQIPIFLYFLTTASLYHKERKVLVFGGLYAIIALLSTVKF